METSSILAMDYLNEGHPGNDLALTQLLYAPATKRDVRLTVYL